jgi:hypothetical protein
MSYGAYERPQVPHKPQSNKRGRGVLPQMGINHPVDYEVGTELEQFFRQCDGAFLEIAPDRIVNTADFGQALRPQFTLLKKQGRVRMTVTEGAPLYKHLKDNREMPQRNDIGRIKGRVADAIGRYIGQPPNPHTVTLSNMQTVGYEDPRNGQLKIGMMADPLCWGGIVVSDEHEIALTALSEEIPSFEPDILEPFTPHVALAQFISGTPAETVSQCIEAAQKILDVKPVAATLGQLTVFPEMDPR